MTSPIITGATADSVSIATKLDEARALIEDRGWCQGHYEHDGGYCAIGAIRQVVSGQPYNWTVEAAFVQDALRKAIRCTFVDSWNDAPHRTQAEVIEAFRKAADLARADAS